MKITDKQMEILEQYFGVDKTEYANGNFLTLEQWTDGGVDMIIEIEMAEEKDLITELEKYIDNFNIDEEIELYRENKITEKILLLGRVLKILKTGKLMLEIA